MKTRNETTVRVDLKFADRARVRPVLEALQQDSTLLVNMLRGRLTPDEAWLQLEITGDARRIDEILGNGDPRIVA